MADRQSSRHPQRGVSLIEALVAIAVMAFGMLGVVGMQATLRMNADISKQRSEAVRLAQERMEGWRRFTVLPTDSTATQYAYDDIASFSTTVTGVNATYGVVGQVAEPPGGQKVLNLTVSWTDRQAQTQSVVLHSVVSRVEPALAATTVVSPMGTPVRSPMGRNGVPFDARDFGDGTSGFKPPQGAGGTVAWLFNNTSGSFYVCATTVPTNADITARGQLTGCDMTQPYLLLAGFVRYATSAAQPTAASMWDPAGPVPSPSDVGVQVNQTAPTSGARSCFVTALQSAFRIYYCALPITSLVQYWSGSVEFTNPPLALAPTLATTAVNQFKVCRYRSAASYTAQKTSLLRENFALIRAGDGSTTAFSCPTGTSGPTWAHQPST